MAGDSAMTAVDLSVNSITLSTVGTVEANDTGDAYLDVSDIDSSKVLFIVEQNGSDTDITLTIGDGDEYTAGAVGNLTQVTTADGKYAFVLESSRFKDSDGYIRISKATADTTELAVTAFLLP